MPGVVFNALAVPHFAQHFQVKAGALLEPLGLHQFVHAHQFFQAIAQLQLDGLHSGQHLVTRRHVMAGGIHREARNFLAHPPSQRVQQLQAFNFVVEEFNADGQLAVLGGKHVDGVAAHPKPPARKIHVVALILHPHQLGNDVALPRLVTDTQRHHHLVVALWFANTVNGRHRGHDDHIAALQQAFRAGQAHLLDVLVDGAVFFNEQIALRHISLGLVVVVITDEILHRVLRKKFSELAVQLCRQGFVGRVNDGRTTHLRNHIRHGEGLA